MRSFVRKSTDLFKKNYLKDEGSGLWEKVYVANCKAFFKETNPSFHLGRSFVLSTILLTQYSSHKGGKKSSSNSFIFSRAVCAQINENVEENCPFLCASKYDWCSSFTFKSIQKVRTQRTQCLRSICRSKIELRHLKIDFFINTLSFFPIHRPCSLMMKSALF